MAVTKIITVNPSARWHCLSEQLLGLKKVCMSLHLPRSLLNTIAQVSQEGDGSSSNDSQRLDGHWHEHVGLV